MARGLPDPSWKSGPTYPEPTSSEHAIDIEPSGVDWDGFGKNEAEEVEGEPLVAVQEYYSCTRDGCDEGMTRRLLFTTHTLQPDELQALRDEAEYDLAEYVWENAEQVDVETIQIHASYGDIGISAEKVVEDGGDGPCYGHEEPDYEGQWRDI